MGAYRWWIGGAGILVLAMAGGLGERLLQSGAAHPAAGECRIPVTLHLGEVDSRFELRRDQVRTALEEAMALWETETPADLFEWRDGSGMPVNLVFDERQATAQVRAAGRADLEERQQELDRRQARLERLGAAFDADVRRYETRRRSLEERQREHARAVADWNAGRGERSAGQRARLEREGTALERERRDLERQRGELDRRRAGLERETRDFEQAVAAFNARVERYNVEGEAYSGFDMGLFRQRGRERSITVYKASDIDELRLVLAHELGHSLGIGHVHDPEAVMYARLGPENAGAERLTPADRRALVDACDVKLSGSVAR